MELKPLPQRVLLEKSVFSGSLSNPWLETAKRLLDLVAALAGLILLSPFLILVAIWIRLDSPGPILFHQWRTGRCGQRFKIWKFRTMVQQADEMLEDFLKGAPEQRLSWEQYQKLWRDPRLTRAGLFLRRFSIDELPQLWNILKGDMSLVGPRPIVPDQLKAYGPGFPYYSQVRPGLTGLWQVSGRNHTSFSQRVLWDQYYVQHWSFGLDISILARTVRVVLSGDGAY